MDKQNLKNVKNSTFLQRLGHFDVSKPSGIYYCSNHWELLSEKVNKWQGKKICLMPQIHSFNKCKTGGKVSLQRSIDYLQNLNYLVPVGSYVCTTCQVRASELIAQAKGKKLAQAELAAAHAGQEEPMEEEDTESNKASQSQSQGSVYVQPSQNSQSSTDSNLVENSKKEKKPVSDPQKDALNQLLSAFGYKVSKIVKELFFVASTKHLSFFSRSSWTTKQPKDSKTCKNPNGTKLPMCQPLPSPVYSMQ